MALDLNLIMGLFLGIPLGGVITYWLFSPGGREKYITKEEKIWECEFCASVYSTDAEEDISKCPFCGSYNKGREL